ncbi:methionyl-tRNA formyltransferase, mitochondrial, partial [Corythoichthys intestinalis]|uniref:methionyl-tRNA formyltransferase, mitochondrial n=1 Tax=Corythoichthys intestinalis TaxID=161448 RepID=UPI0025A551AD
NIPVRFGVRVLGSTLAVLRLLRGEGAAFTGRRLCSSGPPFRLLFFGSDHFAVESLKILEADRSGRGGVVSSLEVVTLSDDVPVADFARRCHLPLQRWPPGNLSGRFDAGVVVSFGCLLRRRLIEEFPRGILNVHPSLLPRWRGPAPIFHTILNGDAVTGVTIMQIRPHKFDTGPILSQTLHRVPETNTSEQLADALAVKGARLLLDTLQTLPQKMADMREQSQNGATFAPKISSSICWLSWEEQTCRQIDRLYRAVGSRFPLRTTWMGHTIKLGDFAGSCQVSWTPPPPSPGSVIFRKESDALAVRCKDGWVSFKTVVLKKRLTAADFYNGYLHRTAGPHGDAVFVSPPGGGPESRANKSTTHCS